MAKAKKGSAEGGATRKQATETKKAAAPKKAEAPKPKATTKAAATTTKSASAEKSSAAGSAATKKKAPAKPAGAGGSVPLIDTSLAAETAAKLVMNRALLGSAAATPPAPEPAGGEEEAGAEKRETSTFKQLKAGLNKPASQGLGGILGTPQQGKKGNFGPGGGGQQVGRNQTFGADVNRSGVPRRTGG